MRCPVTRAEVSFTLLGQPQQLPRRLVRHRQLATLEVDDEAPVERGEELRDVVTQLVAELAGPGVGAASLRHRETLGGNRRLSEGELQPQLAPPTLGPGEQASQHLQPARQVRHRLGGRGARERPLPGAPPVLDRQFRKPCLLAVPRGALLARHCAEAGLAERAVEHWQRAGQRALARSATAEAVTHLTHGLKALAGLPAGPERRRRELALQLALGQALIAAKGFAAPETGRAYARARELCHELGDDVPELFPALYGRFIVHFQRGELAATHEAARELLRLAEERRDASARVTGHRILGSVLYMLGRLAESRAHLEEGLARDDPDRDTAARPSSTRSTWAWSARSGSSTHCLRKGIPSRPGRGWGKRSPTPMRSLTLTRWPTPRASPASSTGGNPRTGRSGQRPTRWWPSRRSRGSRSRWRWAPSSAVGRRPARRGPPRSRRASRGCAPGVAAYEATGAELWVPDFLPLLAQAHARASRPGAGLELLAEALDRVEGNGGRWLEAELHRLRGELLLALPDPDPTAAEACLGQPWPSPGSRRRNVGAARGPEPRPPVARPGPRRRGSRASRARPRLVHRGLRDSGSAGSGGAAP